MTPTKGETHERLAAVLRNNDGMDDAYPVTNGWPQLTLGDLRNLFAGLDRERESFFAGNEMEILGSIMFDDWPTP